MSLPEAVLLDTCAVIWLANGDPMVPAALAAVEHARRPQGVFVSPISAWEVGLLSRPRPGRGAACELAAGGVPWGPGGPADRGDGAGVGDAGGDAGPEDAGV